MPWTTPPTFVNGETLTATKLNQLGEGVNWLNGVGAQPAPMMLSAQQGWYFCPRHTQRYLQVRYAANNSDYIEVYYNGTKIFYDNDPDNGENWLRQQGVSTAYLDLDAVSGFVAYGQPYVLEIRTNANSGGYTLIRLVTETNVAAI
jgi:hypothetical protein